MPAFNAEASLKKSIASFQELAKQVNGATLWVIDDCSTDGSLDLVESIAKGDKNINILFCRFLQYACICSMLF
jgi:glycosyltransferase involved in cell wall biosynthesis